eukprot:60318-Chlamydomonas_euryale.AAC.1
MPLHPGHQGADLRTRARHVGGGAWGRILGLRACAALRLVLALHCACMALRGHASRVASRL